MFKRQYSDNDKAAALAALDANGGNVKKTARETKIPASTITEWRDGRVNPEVANIRAEKELELSEIIENELHSIFEAMKTKRASATYSQLATAAGIFVDKKQLLAGKATERKELTGKDGGAIETTVTVFSNMSDEELDDILAKRHPTGERGEGAPLDTA